MSAGRLNSPQIFLSRSQFEERIGLRPGGLAGQKLPPPDAIIGPINHIGRELAERKSDSDLNAYVRRVESVVVLIMGIDDLTSALELRGERRTIARATDAGVLDEFLDEVDRLRVAGIEGRELMRRLESWLDATISSREGLLAEMKDGLRQMASQVQQTAADLSSNDEPPALAEAARTAPPDYRPGRSEQGEAGGEETQEPGDDYTA